MKRSCTRARRLGQLLLIFLAFGFVHAADTTVKPPARRWIYLSTNLLVEENIGKAETLLREAKSLGFTGLLLADYKLGFWWDHDIREKYESHAKRFRQIVTNLDLELAVAVHPFGYSASLLAHDAHLVAGVPFRDMPLKVVDGILVPQQTAVIPNGSFEEHNKDVVKGNSFQDEPGRISFIDSSDKRDGAVSLRFDLDKDPPVNARISFKIPVKPWQHYRLRAWTKADQLSVDSFRIMAMGEGRILQRQFLTKPDGEGESRFESANELSFDWIEQKVDFNSLDNTEIIVYAGCWGCRGGRFWLDGLKVEAVPFLNVLARDGEPVVIKDAAGKRLEEGKDIEPVRDPRLGMNPWPGEFSTRHDPPVIRLLPGREATAGTDFLASGMHPHLIYDGQVTASPLHTRVLALAERQIEEVARLMQPDVWFLSHDEIRSIGWEDSEKNHPSSGHILAENVKACQEMVRRKGGGKPAMIWSDMFDPTHNAVADFYLARGTLAGSWEGLNPETTIMKWGEGKAAEGLSFFHKRGHPLFIAAYYDHQDIENDAAQWSKASEGLPIQGVMYTTWRNDYRGMARFAQAWWGGEK